MMDPLRAILILVWPSMTKSGSMIPPTQIRGARIDPVNVEKLHLSPPVGGSVVRVFTFLPASSRSKRDLSRFDTGDAIEEENPEMHTTRTIDYGIVLSGELDLELDEGEVRLTAGDVVVQRGTRHAWHNRGTVPCKVAFVLISSPNYR